MAKTKEKERSCEIQKEIQKRKGITLIALVITIISTTNSCRRLNSHANRAKWNTNTSTEIKASYKRRSSRARKKENYPKQKQIHI